MGIQYDDRFTLVIFGKKIALSSKEKTPKAKKAPAQPDTKDKNRKSPKKKKKKRSLKKFSLSLLKEVWELKTGQLIFTKLLKLLKGIGKSLSIKKITGDIGALDYFQTGVLFGLLEAVPHYKKLDLKANFQGEQRVNLAVNLSLARVLFALLRFLVTFPYVKTWKLYNFLHQSNNASKSR